MDLHAKLELFFRLFARRPDVHVWVSRVIPRASPAPQLPADADALLGTRSSCFAWSFDPPEPGDERPEGNGGRLWLDAGHGEGWQSQDERWLDGVASSLLIDDVVAEGLGLLVVDEGGAITDARPAFHDANDEALYRYASLEDYLTQGARKGFVWYWASPGSRDAADVLEQLHEGSLPAGTEPAVLRARLEAQGAALEEAEALWRWLGDDARLLVPAG